MDGIQRAALPPSAEPEPMPEPRDPEPARDAVALAIPREVAIETIDSFEDEVTAPRAVARTTLETLQRCARLALDEDDRVTDPRPRPVAGNDRPAVELALEAPLFREEPAARSAANTSRKEPGTGRSSASGSRAWILAVVVLLVAAVGWIALAPGTVSGRSHPRRPAAAETTPTSPSCARGVCPPGRPD